jgi:hypothetical protein
VQQSMMIQSAHPLMQKDLAEISVCYDLKEMLNDMRQVIDPDIF